jgi:hypothetical protein
MVLRSVTMAEALTLTLRQARNSWMTQQVLGAQSSRTHHSIAMLVETLGWIPISSSAAPYLSLFARQALSQSSSLDEAIFVRGELAVVPGPRGMTWLVPTRDAPLARAFALADHTSREARVASACGLTARDLQSTRDAVRKCLTTAQTPTQLRAQLSPLALRSLEAPGKRAGVNTLAGLVMRGMWVTGEVSRISTDDRLLHDRWLYAMDPVPKVIPGAAEAVDQIASQWLRAHAPASSSEFATAFGIAAGRAATALKRLKPIEVRVDGLDEAMWVPSDFVPREDVVEDVCVVLLPVNDPVVDARLKTAGMCDVAQTHWFEMRHIGIAPTVMVNGEAVGTWWWSSGRISVALVSHVTSQTKVMLESVCASTATFIDTQLGEVLLHNGKQPRGVRTIAGEFTVES